MTREEDDSELRSALERQLALGESLRHIGEVPTARAVGGAAITLHTLGGDDGENDPSEVAEIIAALSSAGLDVESEETGVGWGGDAEALTIVLTSLAAIGTYGGGAELSWRVVKGSVNSLLGALRKIAGRSTSMHLSLGAMTYLCLGDLHDRIGAEFDGVRLVHAGELSPGQGSTIGYSGNGELYTILLVNRTASWLYLVDSSGHVLHRSEGHPPQFGMYSIAGDFGDVVDQRLPRIYDWTAEEA